MKNFKRILGLFVIAVFMLLNVSNANAVDSSITFYKRSLNGVDQYSGSTTSYKEVKTTAGTRVGYCLNKVLSAPQNGAILKLDQELTTPALVYILNNGFNGSNWNTSILPASGYSNDEKYYITQLAIWMAQGSLSPSSLNSGGHIGSAALKLYNAAKSYKLVTPKISVSGGGAMSLSSDGNTYVSPVMTVGGQGYKQATVTLINAPADAKILVNGKSNNNGVKLNPGTKFQVTIPTSKVGANMTIKVRVSSTGLVNKVYRYVAGTANLQNIGLMFNNSTPLSAETSVTIAPRGSLRVTKVDVSSGSEVKLSGVKITVKNSSGQVVGTWTTDANNNPYTINNLALGTYTIIEESAPAGYIKSSNINVTLKAGQTVEVKLTNTKNPTKVKISKQDVTTKAELPGAHLVLKDALGKVVDEWTSTTTPHYIQTLTPGKYTLTETIAPEGYLLSTETVSFTVTNDGKVETVVMYNTPIPDNTLIKISKKDITNEKEVPGATLVVKDANGNVVDQWVSTTQPHYLKDLKEGKYTLIETKSPAGYGISDDVIEFEVTPDGGVEKTVTMYNSPIPVTADMNITLIVAGLIGTVILAGFSIFKLNQQHA